MFAIYAKLGSFRSLSFERLVIKLKDPKNPSNSDAFIKGLRKEITAY